MSGSHGLTPRLTIIKITLVVLPLQFFQYIFNAVA
jgi:hypothetical protein